MPVRNDGKERHLFLCPHAIRAGIGISNNTFGDDGTVAAACCLANYDAKWRAPVGYAYVYVISWPVKLRCPLGGLFADWRHVGQGTDPQRRIWGHCKDREKPIRWLPPLLLIEEVIRSGYESVQLDRVSRQIHRDLIVGAEQAKWRDLDNVKPGFVTGAQKRRPSLPDWDAWARDFRSGKLSR